MFYFLSFQTTIAISFSDPMRVTILQRSLLHYAHFVPILEIGLKDAEYTVVL